MHSVVRRVCALLGVAALVVGVLAAVSVGSTGAGKREFIYWVNSQGTSIGRANLDGSGVDQRFITGTKGACGLAVAGSHIYWGNTNGEQSIGRASLDGTAVNERFIQGNPASRTSTGSLPCLEAVAGGQIYWSVFDGGCGDAVGRANLNGTGANQDFISNQKTPTTCPGGRPFGVCGVAVSGSHIYWGNYFPGGGSIGRASLDGTGVNHTFITPSPDTLGAAPAPVCLVAVEGAHIYWTNLNNGNHRTIGRANLDGSAIDTTFISGLPAGPPSIDGGLHTTCRAVVAGNYVYWARHSAATTIGRAKLNGTGIDNNYITGAINACRIAVG